MKFYSNKVLHFPFNNRPNNKFNTFLFPSFIYPDIYRIYMLYNTYRNVSPHHGISTTPSKNMLPLEPIHTTQHKIQWDRYNTVGWMGVWLERGRKGKELQWGFYDDDDDGKIRGKYFWWICVFVCVDYFVRVWYWNRSGMGGWRVRGWCSKNIWVILVGWFSFVVLGLKFSLGFSLCFIYLYRYSGCTHTHQFVLDGCSCLFICLPLYMYVTYLCLLIV